MARELLGKKLVRLVDGQRLAGWIIEAEAYDGELDLACHAKAGKTPRTAVMYGPAGRAYVYFTYGMHWMLNCVCEAEGYPAAVLIRGIFPVEGLALIAQKRQGVKREDWVNGPAKICAALSITGKLNGLSLCNQTSGLWVEDGEHVSTRDFITTPRIGIDRVPEPWLSHPWRFFMQTPEKFFAKD